MQACPRERRGRAVVNGAAKRRLRPVGSAADGGEGKLSSPQRLEKSRNREALLTCGLPPGRAAKIAALVLSVQQSRD